MATETKKLTLREIMANGKKGGFARALYNAYTKPDDQLLRLWNVWCIADEQGRALIEKAFPMLDFVAITAFYNAIPGTTVRLQLAFPGLRRLDEPMDDPFAFDLAGGATDGQ